MLCCSQPYKVESLLNFKALWYSCFSWQVLVRPAIQVDWSYGAQNVNFTYGIACWTCQNCLSIAAYWCLLQCWWIRQTKRAVRKKQDCFEKLFEINLRIKVPNSYRLFIESLEALGGRFLYIFIWPNNTEFPYCCFLQYLYIE